MSSGSTIAFFQLISNILFANDKFIILVMTLTSISLFDFIILLGNGSVEQVVGEEEACHLPTFTSHIDIGGEGEKGDEGFHQLTSTVH